MKIKPVRSDRAPGRVFWLALAAYVGFNLLMPLVPLPPRLSGAILAGLVLLSTAVFMLLQLWLAQATVFLKPRAAMCGGLMVLFLLLWGGTFWLVFPHRGWSHAVNLPLFILRPLLLGLAITLGCAFFGILLSRIIREPNVLLPVALVAIPIDYIGAMTPIGFTQNAVANNPALVQAVSVPVPAVGSSGPHGGIHPIAFIGPGDALFMAFFYAVVLRLNLNVRGTFWLMYALLTATMLTVLFTDINVAALIPMGIAVIAANFRYFKLKREEIFATFYAAVLIFVLVGGFYAYSHTHFFRSSKIRSPQKGTLNADPSPARSAPRGPAGN